MRENNTKVAATAASNGSGDYDFTFLSPGSYSVKVEILGFKTNFGFDPNNVTPLPGKGNVYPTFHVSDDWGTLQVENGALLNDSYNLVTVSAPKNTAGNHISGDGWKLDLNEGWRIVPRNRSGDFNIAKSEQ